jgi:hypothetical protein
VQPFEALGRTEGVDLAGARLKPRAWEQDGQVWICLSGAAPSGPAPSSVSQKAMLGRLVLRAVTP